MRKLAVFVVTAFVLGIAAVAYAQVQNVYTVSGSTNPTRAGSKTKPVPVEVNFGYEVGEQNGNRPSPVKKYSIKMAGIVVNTDFFAKCSFRTLQDKGPRACPSASKMGTGFIKNATGSKADPADRSIECNAALSVYNSGNRKGVIYVAGSPNSTDPRTRCAIELGAPIDASYVRSRDGKSTALEFTVPQSLLHPLPTLDNAVTSVSSKIRRTTKRVKGKTRGYFESIGGCVRGKRTITVTFTPESGTSKRAQRLAPCKA